MTSWATDRCWSLARVLSFLYKTSGKPLIFSTAIVALQNSSIVEEIGDQVKRVSCGRKQGRTYTAVSKAAQPEVSRTCPRDPPMSTRAEAGRGRGDSKLTSRFGLFLLARTPSLASCPTRPGLRGKFAPEWYVEKLKSFGSRSSDLG
jgi:hypothetical protein